MNQTAFIALTLAILPGAANAKSCWVEEVYQRGNGIAVRFIPNSPAHIYVSKPDNSGILYRHEQGKYFLEAETETAPVEISEIPMDIGDTVRLGNSGHDTCTIQAVIEDGNKGLKANAFFYAHIPDQPPEKREEFFPAE